MAPPVLLFVRLMHRFFPQTTDFKPVPLKVGEEEDYMLALKQEMRGAMRSLPYNIKPLSNRVGEEQILLQQKRRRDERRLPGEDDAALRKWDLSSGL